MKRRASSTSCCQSSDRSGYFRRRRKHAKARCRKNSAASCMGGQRRLRKPEMCLQSGDEVARFDLAPNICLENRKLLRAGRRDGLEVGQERNAAVDLGQSPDERQAVVQRSAKGLDNRINDITHAPQVIDVEAVG